MRKKAERIHNLKKSYNTLENKYYSLLENRIEELTYSLNKVIKYEKLKVENKKLRKNIKELKKNIK